MQHGQRVVVVVLSGLFAGFLLQSCANGDRGPTSPSPSVQISAVPGRVLSWQCMQQGTTVTLTGGWSFSIPATDCPAALMAPSAVAVDAVSAAPTNFRSTVTGSTVRLDWNGIGEPVASFRIEAGSAPTLSNLATLNTGNAAVTLTVTNVPNGAYYVRVRAVGGDGVPGPASNEIVVRVGGAACSAAPLAPTAFTRTVTGTLVNLSWMAPAGGDAPATYFVDAGSASTLSNIIVFDTGSAATALAVTAPNGTYYVRLRAVNACGSSPPSNEVVVSVPGDSGPETLCTYNVSPASVSLTNSGGEFDVNVSAGPSCAWSAAPLSGFVTLTSPSSSSGNGTARFSAASNNTGQQRQGGVRISWAGGSRDVSITQEATASGGGGGGGGGGTSCSYVVTPNTVTLSSISGTFDVSVTTTNPACAWLASSTFASVVGAGSSTGTANARFGVPQNDGGERSGTARISWNGGQQDIAIRQLARPPDPPPTAPTIDGNLEVPPQNGISDNRLVTGTPSGTCGTPQAGCGPIVNPVTGTPAGGSSLFVDITAASQFDTILTAVGAIGPNGAPVSSSYRVLTLSSPRTSARITVNAVTGQSFTAQFAVTLGTLAPTNYVSLAVTPPCTYSLTPPGTLPSAGGPFDVTVNTQPGCAWTASSLSTSFISVTGGAGTGSGAAHFSITANTGTGSRQGTVRVAGQDLTITQQGATCSYALSMSSTDFPSAGDVRSMSITTQAGCSWRIVNAVSWIQVGSANVISGAQSVTVNVSVAANTSTVPRSGQIVLDPGPSGPVVTVLASLTINQAAANVAPRLTSPGCSFAGKTPGSTITCPGAAVDDNAGDVITWTTTASHTCSWFTVSPYTPANPVSVSLGGTVPANFTGTCNIDIAVCDQHLACVPYTGSYTWNPPMCTYTVSPTNIFVGAQAGSVDVHVTTAAGCQWSASGQSFPFVSSIELLYDVIGSGGGNGIARIHYSTNPSTTNQRTGSIKIVWATGEQVVALTQAAP